MLTSTALHYYQRDRHELYGKERGVFLLESMATTYYPEKLWIEIRNVSTGVMRMLKAPTEREFMTWCRAFDDAIGAIRAGRANGGIEQSGAAHQRPGGMSLDSLHTIAPRMGRRGDEESVSGTNGGGSQRPSGLLSHPLYGGSNAQTTPITNRTAHATHGAKNQHGSTPAQASKSNGGSHLVADQTPSLLRIKSSPPPTTQRLAPPGISHDGYSSGVSASPVLSPIDSRHPSPDDQFLGVPLAADTTTHTGATHTKAHKGGANNKMRQNANGGSNTLMPADAMTHVDQDVLRKYSVSQDAPPILDALSRSNSLRTGAHTNLSGVRDTIVSVVLNTSSLSGSESSGSIASSPHTLSTNLPWHSGLLVPFFGAGSNLAVTLHSGGHFELDHANFATEVGAGLKEGSKLVVVNDTDESGTMQDDGRKVLLSWKILTPTTKATPVPTPSYCVLEFKLTPSERAQFVLLLGAPLLFILLFLVTLQDTFASGGSALTVVLIGLLHSLAGFVYSLEDLRKRRTNAVATNAMAKADAEEKSTGPLMLEVTFLSLFDSKEGVVSNSPSASPLPLSGGGGSGGSASRKKKGILRRRANDLPNELTLPIPIKMSSRTPKEGDFELSEYSDTSQCGSGRTTRESSLMGLTHRRRGSANSSSGNEIPVRITPNDHHDDDAHASSNTLSLSTPSGPSSSAPPLSIETTSVSMGHLNDHESASHGSSGCNPDFSRQPSGRSEDSEPADFETDADSSRHGGDEVYLDADEDGHDDDSNVKHGGMTAEEDAEMHAAIMDALNQYEDTLPPEATTATGPASGQPENPAPWSEKQTQTHQCELTMNRSIYLYLLYLSLRVSVLICPSFAVSLLLFVCLVRGAWMEDDVSVLKVRGLNFLEDKIKIPVGTPIFKLIHVDMFYTPMSNPNLVHVTSRPGNWGYKYLQRREEKFKEMMQGATNNASANASPSAASSSASGIGVSSAYGDSSSPLFVMNFLFPGPHSKNMNLVLYFVRRVRPGEELRRRKELGITSRAVSRRGSRNVPGGNNAMNSPVDPASRAGSASSSPPLQPLASPSVSYSPDQISRVCAFDGLLRRFLDGWSGPSLIPLTDNEQKDLDDFRDCRLKIIPRIAAGPWIVRKGVGCVPAILGKKVKQRYYRDVTKNYIEVVADVSSSMVAGKILQLVKSAATALTIDLSFTLQGETLDELPESLLGGVRILRCNLDKLLTVEEHEKWIAETWIPNDVHW